ncbi:MAG: deoxynucleoside kinase [Flavobacteriales bacterium]|nr:deoxynucleoside kinase [Flavobacteriales bacterium]
MRYRYIAIEGNIGAGKTSLATRLATESGSTLMLEEFSDNPFLPKFYNDAARYAFPLELSFLSERFSQLKRELLNRDLFSPGIVADYFISKSNIFAKNNLTGDELELFQKVFQIIEPTIPQPDMLVYLYLEVENLQRNIKMRGRPYEQMISDEYLEKIQSQYMTFIKQHRKIRTLIINTNEIDFVNSEEDYQWMKKEILSSREKGVFRI